jgi:putative transposase
MSDVTYYNCRAKFSGMDVSMMARMKELEEGSGRLKKMHAKERLKAENLNRGHHQKL